MSIGANLGLQFYYVGVVVSNLEGSITFYKSLGYSSSEIFTDLVQKARIVLQQKEHDLVIELGSSGGPDSPSVNQLIRINARLFHLCYEVDELEEVITHLRNRRLFGSQAPCQLWHVI